MSVAVTEEPNKFSVGDPATGVFWYFLIGGFFIQLFPFTGDQAVAQRFLTTPDTKSAARSAWAHAAMVVPASLLFFGLGTALYVFYASRPGEVPVAGQTDIIVPWFIVTQLPAGFAGLVIAGLFDATMSSVDSGMHSIATTLTNDVYSKLCPGANDGTQLAVSWIITVLAGLCGAPAAVPLTVPGLHRGPLWDLLLLLPLLLPIHLPGLPTPGPPTNRPVGVSCTASTP